MNKLLSKILYFIFLIQFAGCENNYNKMLDWVEQIPVGTNIELVKKDQPYYVKIDWQNPDTINNSIYYEIIVLRNHDILRMQNFLVFDDDKFQERAYIK